MSLFIFSQKRNNLCVFLFASLAENNLLKRFYHIYSAIKQSFPLSRMIRNGFPLSRMITNN